MKITYICAQTNQKIESEEGLPSGWVISSIDLSQDKDKPFPPKRTVIAFSSQKAADDYKRSLLKTRMQTLDF